MKMRTKLFALAILALFVVPTASAQQPVSIAIADDTSIAMLVRYVGANTSADVAVETDGNLTFRVAATAYDGFECPVSGALGGVIDVSDAACNTMGEVVDTINGSGSDFRAVLVDSYRAEVSTDAMVTFSATEVTRTDGLQLNIDTDVIFTLSYALIPVRNDISVFLGGPPNYRLLENPFGGMWASLQWLEGASTYGSGTSNWYVYSVKPSNKASGSETVTTLWGPEAGAATTVTKQLSQFQTNMLPGRFHEKMIVHLVNSAAMASTSGFALAQLKPIP